MQRLLKKLFKKSPKRHTANGLGNTVPQAVPAGYEYAVQGNENFLDTISGEKARGTKFLVTGSKNKIQFQHAEHVWLHCDVIGDSNTVDISEDSQLKNIRLRIIGHNNSFLIGKGSRLKNSRISIKGSNQTVIIGAFTTIEGCHMLCQERCNITMGSHCMISRGIEIRTTDAHSVVDIKSGKRTNSPGSVTIGSHVWLAANVFVSKNVRIADDCIVGAGSVVVKDLPEPHAIYAGVPAVLLRQGVTWNRGRKSKYSAEELNGWKQE